MRLIDSSTKKLVSFPYDTDRPQYAILSHTWGPLDDEVLFDDMMAGRNTANGKRAYKIRMPCRLSRNHNLGYCWIDTCCIDKSSSAELQEALNSMYKWYSEAKACFVYLADVDEKKNEISRENSQFRRSRWFTRGWTLQELLAPPSTALFFYNKHWEIIATKYEICDILGQITGIDSNYLKSCYGTFSVAQRMSWASKRQTSRIEDKAYCLLGIFDINMPMLYGEGSKAFIRLQEEIIKSSEDYTIFAWRSTDESLSRYSHVAGGVLATDPSGFAESGDIVDCGLCSGLDSPMHMTARGLCIPARLFRFNDGIYAMFVGFDFRKERSVAIILGEQNPYLKQFMRTNADQFLATFLSNEGLPSQIIYIPQESLRPRAIRGREIPRTPSLDYDGMNGTGLSKLELKAFEEQLEGRGFKYPPREEMKYRVNVNLYPLFLSHAHSRKWVQYGWIATFDKEQVEMAMEQKYGCVQIELSRGKKIAIILGMTCDTRKSELGPWFGVHKFGSYRLEGKKLLISEKCQTVKVGTDLVDVGCLPIPTTEIKRFGSGGLLFSIRVEEPD